MFSGNVTGFIASDITVTGGTRGALSGSGTDYTLAVTAGSGAGTTTVSIAADVVSPGNTAASQDFTRSALPSVTITSDDSDIHEGETFITTFEWSEDVTGFATGDVTVTGATKGTFTATDADTYTLQLTAGSGAGTITVTVDEDAVALGNIETAQDFTRSALPTVDITVNNADIQEDDEFTASFTWSESVSGFTQADITITGGTHTGFGGSGTTYQTTVTAASGEGEIVITVAEDAVSTGNAEYSETFTRSGTPTVDISTDDTDIRAGETVDIDLVFSESVTGLATGDFTITNGTINSLSGSGTTYTLEVTASTTAGTLTIELPATAVTPNIVAASQDFTINALPTVTITASDDPVENGEETTFTFQWSESVSGFNTADVTISAGTKGTFTAVDADTYTLVVTAPSSGTGQIEATVAEDAVTLGNAETSHSVDYEPAAVTPITSGLTGASVLIANSAGLGQSELRPRGLDSDGTYLYALGVSRRRVIRITDLDTFASEFASAQLTGNLNSLAFNDGGFYYADNNNAIFRIDSPFTDASTSTSLGNITNSGAVRSLCSDRTNLFGYDKTNSILYRIVDNGDGTVTATTFATVAFPTGTTGNVNSLFYFEDAFYLPNNDDDNLWKLPDNLTSGSLDVVPVRVGNFTEFDVSEGNPAGAGVLGSEAYFVGDDNNSLYRFLQTTTATTDAVLTISTDDTDIRAGEVVEIDITSDIDISDFVASDITVTGGTRGALTETDAQNWVLSVTAGSAGTLTVSIAEDAVSPGNAAASQDFTINALPTVDITVDDDNIHESESFTATFQWSESVTGFITGDVTVTGATKGTFTAVDGDTYTLSLTAGTGAGTITITVDTNAVGLGNASYSEDFTRSAATISNQPTTLSVSVSTTSATLSWTAPTDDGGADITEYQVSSDDGATWSDTDSTDTEYTITGLIANTEYTFRVRAVNSVGNSTASSSVVRTTSTSTSLAIEDIDEQFILINTTDYALEIEIYNGTADTDFEIESSWEGFYYDWDYANDLLIVRSQEATRLFSDATWTITATEGSDTATATIIYNVVPIAPVISDPGTLTLYRNNEFNEDVAISNAPSSIQVDGLQAALKFEASDSGVNLAGTLPTDDANITQTEFDGIIVASNDGGEHTRTVTIEIGTGVAPSAWADISDPYTAEVGASFTLNLSDQVSGTPNPIITLQSGSIPSGLELSINDDGDYVLSGNYESAGTYAPVFRATNGDGTSDSEAVNFTVYAAFVAPTFTGTIPNTTLAYGETISVASYFNTGSPPGTYSLSASFLGGFINSNTGIITNFNTTGFGDSRQTRVVVTNVEGSAQSNLFNLVFESQ